MPIDFLSGQFASIEIIRLQCCSPQRGRKVHWKCLSFAAHCWLCEEGEFNLSLCCCCLIILIYRLDYVWSDLDKSGKKNIRTILLKTDTYLHCHSRRALRSGETRTWSASHVEWLLLLNAVHVLQICAKSDLFPREAAMVKMDRWWANEISDTMFFFSISCACIFYPVWSDIRSKDVSAQSTKMCLPGMSSNLAVMSRQP